ncbi:MAG: RNase adapter RapZ [Deltaproteobacteria bacterium]|nr:RNase adapter RapZ [Deltaproteobacteria bacterium]
MISGDQSIKVVIISGLSGSGKSTAVKVLEDLDYYCVDNLPLVLVTTFVDLCRQSGTIQKVGLVADVREGEFLKEFPAIHKQLREGGTPVEVLFLEAGDEALTHRFQETRRRHPLTPTGTVLDGIRLERRALEDVRRLSDHILDTSSLTVHDLRREVNRLFTGSPDATKMTLSLVSFGYRNGLPEHADLTVDVRFLPNPNFVEELRLRTGLEQPVTDYVLSQPETQAFIEKFFDLIDFLVPLYEKEGKAYLTIGIGCTGGRHRSVVIVRELEKYLKARHDHVLVDHRDIGRH